MIFLFRDGCSSRADFLRLPFVQPRPDPVIQLIDEEGGRQTAPDQPYIHRVTRLGALAEEMGRGIEFADEVSLLIWGGTAGWDEGDHLVTATKRAGLDPAEMDQRVVAEADRLERVIETNQPGRPPSCGPLGCADLRVQG